MGWHYTNPMSFPAAYIRVIRESVANTENPIILLSTITRPDAEAVAENFRRFKWCCKQEGSDPWLRNAMDDYDFRAVIAKDEVGYIISIRARATKIGEFIRCNPDLAAALSMEIGSHEQD